MIIFNCFCACAGLAAAGPADVYIQAHRGGLKEVPENTIVAYRHAWGIPGAIPEIDVCTTADNVMVCIHDDTPGRTTTCPAEFKSTDISKLTSDQLRQWDAGVRFNERFAGARIPLLTEVFDEMKGHPDRQAYLDLKDIDLAKLMAQIHEYGLDKQVIFVRESPPKCAELQRLFPGVRTMTWFSGKTDTIMRKFEALAAEGFPGVSQIQLHLQVRKDNGIQFVLPMDFLRKAVEETKKAGIDLQVRPFDFDKPSLQSLLDLGICWYVADEPQRFSEVLATCSK